MKWKSIVEDNCDLVARQTIPMLLVQNKCDLLETLTQESSGGTLPVSIMPEETLNEESKKKGFIGGMHVSSLKDETIEKAFKLLLEEVDRRITAAQNGVSLAGEPNKMNRTSIVLSANPGNGSPLKRKNSKCCT
jgi:GTPase SAR1 family protein